MQETEASSVIYTQGCIDSLTLWINDHLHIVGGLAFGFALIQVRSDLVIVCFWRLSWHCQFFFSFTPATWNSWGLQHDSRYQFYTEVTWHWHRYKLHSVRQCTRCQAVGIAIHGISFLIWSHDYMYISTHDGWKACLRDPRLESKVSNWKHQA